MDLPVFKAITPDVKHKKSVNHEDNQSFHLICSGID